MHELIEGAKDEMMLLYPAKREELDVVTYSSECLVIAWNKHLYTFNRQSHLTCVSEA